MNRLFPLSPRQRPLIRGMIVVSLAAMLLILLASGVVANPPQPMPYSDTTLTPSATGALATGSADLLIDQFTYSGGITVPIAMPIGDRFGLTIRNAGSTDAGAFWVGFYVSSDSTITTSDKLLLGGHEYVSGLATGQSMTVALASLAEVPRTMSPGPAYLGVIVDETNLVSETNEANNTAAFSTTLVYQGPPQVIGQAMYPGSTAGADSAVVIVESPDGTPFAQVTADAQGYFQVFALRAGTYRVRAFPPAGSAGYTPSFPTWVSVADTATTYDAGTLVLTSPNLSGTVETPLNQPVADALVVLHEISGDFSLDTVTDAQGTFVFGGVPAGDYHLQAHPPKGSSWASSLVHTINANGSLAGTNVSAISLTSPAVMGQVTDPVGSTGVDGAFTLLYDSNWKLVSSAQADPGGYFKLGGLAEGLYKLELLPPDGDYSLARSGPFSVRVVSGTVTDVGTVPLNKAQVQGQVFEPDGTPHRNGTVFVGHGAVSEMRIWEVDTDWAGRFRGGGLITDTTYLARARPRRYGLGFADSVPVSFTVPSAVTASSATASSISYVPALTLPLTLLPARLAGQVVDGTGSPVTGAGVVLFRDTTVTGTTTAPLASTFAEATSLSTESAWAISDYGGLFALGGVSAGTYRLQAFPPSYRTDLLSSGPVSVTIGLTGTVHLNTPLALQAITKKLIVAVQRNNATPVTDGEVRAMQRGSTLTVNARAGSDGLYYLDLAAGEWGVAVSPITTTADWLYTDPPQIVTFDTTLRQETKRITLTVKIADAHVTGTVLDPNGDFPPVGSVFVDVRDDDGNGNGGATDASGHFDVAVPPGTYNVSIYVLSGNWLATELPPVQVASGQSVDMGTIWLQSKTSHISGRVTRSDTGDGVPGVKVRAWNKEGNHSRTATDATGYYTLTVAPGVWYVGVPISKTFLSNVPLQRVRVDTAGGTVGGVDFVLAPAPATIQGAVVNQFGWTMSDVDAWAYARVSGDTSGAVAGGNVVRQGQFSFPVPAGDYKVGLFLPPGSPYVVDSEQSVSVGAGQVATVKLVVRPADAQIIGRFDLGIGGVAAAVAQQSGIIGHVFAYGGNGQGWHSAPIYADGRFTLTVAAGTWRVSYRIESDDYVAPAQQSYRVIVQAGEVYDVGAIPLLRTDSVIQGVVQRPSGLPFPGALVWAVRIANGRQIRFTAEAASPDGTFTMRVPVGIYKVGASAPRRSAYRSPPIQTVVASPSSPVSVTLRFRAVIARLKGVVGISGATGIVGVEGAYIWGWSEEGAHVEETSGTDGAYRVWLSPGTWHLGSAYQAPDRTIFRSDEVSVTVSSVTTLEQNFALHQVGKLPAGRTVSFNANEVQVIRLDDGTEVFIPAGALATSGRVWVVIAPTVNDVPYTWLAQPLRFGYALQAFDDSGRQITGGFYKNVLISFHYDDSDLPPGTSEDRLVPIYFSTTTQSWTPVDSYVLDPVANRVTAEINHFSMWAESMWAESMWAEGTAALYMPILFRGP